MKLGKTQIQFEEDNERLKVWWPVTRNVPATAIYSVLATVWFAGLVIFVYSLFNPPSPRGIDDLPTSLAVVWVIGVMLWLYVWIRYIGRNILRWWQFYLAKREILFVYEDSLVIRRPVSLLGLTDAYDRRHTSPFFLNDEYEMLGFQYGNVRRVLFGQTLALEDRQTLLNFLNNRYFPELDDDDDDED